LILDGPDGVQKKGGREAVHGHVHVREVAAADAELAPEIVAAGHAGEHLNGAQMAAVLSQALGEPVRHVAMEPPAYAALGFPGADDLANMFAFKHDFNAEFCAARDVAATRELHPGLKTIVLTSSDDPSDISGAFAAGAAAYVIKTAHADDIASAIRQAFDHSIFFSPPALAPAETMAPSNGADELTRREFEILKLAADGHSNAQMAKMLWVTEQTVKFHLSNIYRKLDVSNRTEASRWAQLHGLLTVPDSARADERPNEFRRSP